MRVRESAERERESERAESASLPLCTLAARSRALHRRRLGAEESSGRAGQQEGTETEKGARDELSYAPPALRARAIKRLCSANSPHDRD